MLKKFAVLLSTLTLTLPGTQVLASPYQKTVARMACSSYSQTMIINPEYYGQTRSGLDIWICVETGSSRRTFFMFDSGPYAVLACNRIQCQLIDWTY